MVADSPLVGSTVFWHGCLWGPECPRTVADLLLGRARFFCGSWLLNLESPGTGASLLVGRYAPSANRLEGGLQNGTCKHQCPSGKKSFQKWLLPVFPSPGGVSVASYLSRRLSKISKLVDPGSYETTVFVLGLRACEILCVPFRSWISVSYSFLAFLNISCAGFQRQTSCIGPRGWGA